MAEDANQSGSDKSAEHTAEPSAALPSVESPSISPAETPAESEAKTQACVAASKMGETAPLLSQNRTRFGLLAASFVAVAGMSGVLGAFAISLSTRDTGVEQERVAMQQSLAQLTQEIASLKSDLVASEKTARTQTARIADLDASLKAKLARDQVAVTGSISAPATTAAKSSEPTPLPPPKPQIETASARHSIVEGWTVLGARRGFVYVRSGSDIYRVLPGDRLPGVGLVEDIRRDDLGWVVVTPRGFIVASGRGGFDRF